MKESNQITEQMSELVLIDRLSGATTGFRAFVWPAIRALQRDNNYKSISISEVGKATHECIHPNCRSDLRNKLLAG
jgi:hypothetical protein